MVNDPRKTGVIRRPALGCKCSCHDQDGPLCGDQDCCENHWQRPDQYDWEKDQPTQKLEAKKIYDGPAGKMWGTRHKPINRIMVGIPLTGLIRAEWMMARYGQVIPCNWSQIDAIKWIESWSPINFLVADARNSIVQNFIEQDYEWLFFIDHDTMIPPGTVLKLNERMLEHKIPVWSGLYFTKSAPSEPLVYRGRGNGYFTDWKIGEEVWTSAVPMGCTMIHRSILKIMWEEAEQYEYKGTTIRKVFETPARTWFDPETHNWYTQSGTEDLEWCMQLIERDIFARAGWKEYQEKEYPFMVDTNIFCRHIDWDGVQYPAHGEEMQFMDLKKNIKDIEDGKANQ